MEAIQNQVKREVEEKAVLRIQILMMSRVWKSLALLILDVVKKISDLYSMTVKLYSKGKL